jgi:hypothetical protein
MHVCRGQLLYAKIHAKNGMVEIPVAIADVLLDVIDTAILTALDLESAEAPKTRKRRTKAELSVVRFQSQ